MFRLHSQLQKEQHLGHPQDRLMVCDLIVAGFSHPEVDALIIARDKWLKGELNELAIDYRSLCFAQWLYDHGRIDG